MTAAGTWYPPELGTGGFLLTNPPFAPMTDGPASFNYPDPSPDRTHTNPFTGKPVAPMTTDIATTLQERGQRYGKFTSHAEITIAIKAEIGRAIARTGCSLQPDQLEALHMIAHKIGRIINGDPNYADSWVDIAGYAQLVADRLNGVER